jgi:uncharacterized protein YodC (DUF2158 family)
MAQQEDNGINVGDVVRLKSGGPKMTVEKIVPQSSNDTELSAQCWWFVKDEEVKTNQFCLKALKLMQECQTP